MAESFWHAVRDQRYREATGQAAKDRAERDREEREKDKKLRKELGRDCPKPYRWGGLI